VQAAYHELDEAQRTAAHLRLGRQLLAGLTEKQLEEHVFTVLHHFNVALALITDTEERLKLAKFNLIAGQRSGPACLSEPRGMNGSSQILGKEDEDGPGCTVYPERVCCTRSVECSRSLLAC
jgi:hypothetical protein